MVQLTSDMKLRDEFLQALVIGKLSQITFESPQKVRGGLLDMVMPE